MKKTVKKNLLNKLLISFAILILLSVIIFSAVINADIVYNDPSIFGHSSGEVEGIGFWVGQGGLYTLSKTLIGSNNKPNYQLEVVGDLKISGAGNGIFFPNEEKQTSASIPRKSYFCPPRVMGLNMDRGGDDQNFFHIGCEKVSDSVVRVKRPFFCDSRGGTAKQPTECSYMYPTHDTADMVCKMFGFSSVSSEKFMGYQLSTYKMTLIYGNPVPTSSMWGSTPSQAIEYIDCNL